MVKSKNISEELLTVLANSKLGMSISKMAQQLQCSRATISKYLTKLESDKKVFVQNIGQYKLWLHRANYMENKAKNDSLTNFYKPLYNSIIKNLPQLGLKEEKLKHLGKLIAKDLNFSEITQELLLDPGLQKMNADPSNINSMTKNIMRIIDMLCQSFDKYTWKPPIILNKDSIFVLRMENSEYIHLPSHFHMLAGIIEKEMDIFQSVKVSISQILTDEKIVDFKFELQGHIQH
jgi:DNA-binding transcriptional regulator YhcF (GntR family)